MTNNQLSAKAYVLHQRPYRNTSVIVSLLVQDVGFVQGVLRGGQKKGLQLFTPYWLYYKPREGLSQLNKIEVLERGVELHEQSLFCGLYLNELLVNLLYKFEAQGDLCLIYEAAINDLNCTEKVDIVLRRFELLLLRQIGFALTFNIEAGSSQRIEEASYYSFYPESGLIKVVVNKRHNKSRRLYLGRDLLAISNDIYSVRSTQVTAKLIMRQMIDHLLNGKVLQSRELFLGVVQ